MAEHIDWAASARSWFRLPASDSPCRARLFCLPHAGGSASAFAAWPALLPSDVDVCPVQLPGRQNRLAEKPFTSMTALVQTLAEVMAPVADRPFALFGHSMGGLIAFELARQMRRCGYREPAALLIASCGAPQLPRVGAPMSSLPPDAFLAALRRFRGIPDSVLRVPDLLELVLPTVKADVILYDTYEYVREPPLAAAISVYAGASSDEALTGRLSAWSQLTTGAFRLQTFAGAHFFTEESRDALLQSVTADLAVAVV